MSRLSRMTCSKNIRPETGLSSIWVSENSACKHPVDALDLELHMLGKDIADRSRYGHDGLRSDGRPAGQLTATCGSYTGPVRRSRSPTDRSPQLTGSRRHDSSGWGEAPLVLQPVRPVIRR